VEGALNLQNGTNRSAGKCKTWKMKEQIAAVRTGANRSRAIWSVIFQVLYYQEPAFPVARQWLGKVGLWNVWVGRSAVPFSPRTGFA